MSDQSTKLSEEDTTAQTAIIDWDWHVRMFFVYALLALILATLMDISDALTDQKNQDEQANVEELDLAYAQVEILYGTQQIICDVLDGPNEQVSGTTPTNTEEPSIPTTTTTPASLSLPTPGDLGYVPPRPPTTAVDPIEAYC